MRNKHSARRQPQQEVIAATSVSGPDILHELIPIVLAERAEPGSLWNIGQPRQQRYRRKGLEIYVDFTLEIEPYDGSESIAFLFAVPEDARYQTIYGEAPAEDDVRYFTEAVLQGIQGALQEMAAQGIPMANLLVGLTELGIHPIDSRRGIYLHYAHGVMRSLLEPDHLVIFSG